MASGEGGKPRIDFLRHASSEFNEGISKRDPNITETGKQQAAQVEGEYDLVIISTLIRTRQTLECSKIRYKDLIETDLCREYRAGSICDWKADEPEVVESWDHLQARFSEFKKLLVEYSKIYPRILVITHALFMYYLMNLNHGVYNCQMINYR